MKKELKVGLFIFLLLSALFILYAIFGTIRNRKTDLSWNFTGIVDKIDYDEKGVPNVIVNGKEYYLSAGYNFDH